MPNIIQLTTAPVEFCERITKDWFDIEDEFSERLPNMSGMMKIPQKPFGNFSPV